MKRLALLLLLTAVASPLPAKSKAKNVILFIGDAGGSSTLNAASAYLHGKPQSLYIQKMPYIGLSDTSASGEWVTDSAAGMTAIVTGRKTGNGVLSQGPDAVRGKKDGTVLKTILEYAEEKGLSTAVISNMSMVDATPAACYAHSNIRSAAGEIAMQILTPRFGDGVDMVIGGGRKPILAATEKMSVDFEAKLKEKGFAVASSPGAIPKDAKRVVALFESGDFDPIPVVDQALNVLSSNKKGYFLMVEWDMHTTNIKRGLDRVGQMDEMIRRVAARVTDDTLIIFAADHSFDIRLRGGKIGEPLLPAEGVKEEKPKIRVENGHTGEEVAVAAQGPGAELVKGYMPNTRIFEIMMAAYGWKESPQPAAAR
ncbi:MAG TPA: alkaline phosphatase [Bryobacteraceae bacterium]|nr:alkaline phosphatase [Bryobacteraceae bacterium]